MGASPRTGKPTIADETATGANKTLTLT